MHEKQWALENARSLYVIALTAWPMLDVHTTPLPLVSYLNSALRNGTRNKYKARMKKVFFFLQVVALFLLLKTCSDLCVGGWLIRRGSVARSLHFSGGDRPGCKKWHSSNRSSHPWQPVQGGTDYEGLGTWATFAKAPSGNPAQPLLEKFNTALAKKIKRILVERTIQLEESLFLVSRVGGKPLVLTRSTCHWQDRLGFVLAWLLYRGKVALRRDALPS